MLSRLTRFTEVILRRLWGHEDPFPPRWLNVRCVIRHGTFAETNGNGRDAPILVLRESSIEVPA
jgi:hypothetical protein